MLNYENLSFYCNRAVKGVLAAVTSAAVLTFSFTGCTPNEIDTDSTVEDSGKISVVATIFPQYDFSRQIAGDCADVTMLLGPGEESHTYEPTPQDIIKIQEADIFIYVGGESEAWVDGVLKSMDTSNMEIISLMDTVDVVEEELIEGMEEYEESEDHAGEEEYDEHVWTSLDNAQIISQTIADALCEVDEENTATYRSNCENYLSELSSLKRDFTRVVNNGQRKTVVFGDRFPLRYFADEFGLDYYAAFAGCAEQSEPSAGTVAYLIEKVNEESIPVVFYLELSNGKIAQTIAESTGADTLCFNSCHNVTMEDFLNGITYVDLMNSNLEALEQALK